MKLPLTARQHLMRFRFNGLSAITDARHLKYSTLTRTERVVRHSEQMQMHSNHLDQFQFVILYILFKINK